MNTNLINKTAGILTLAGIIVSSISPVFADIMIVKSLGNPEYSETVIINGNGIKVIKSDSTSNINSDVATVNDRINGIKSVILQKINNINDLDYDISDSDNVNTEISETLDSKSSSEETTAIENTSAAAYSEYVTKVIELTNAERAKYKLLPLKLSDSLCKSAQEHANDMYANNYFSHTSQDGRTMSDRIEKYSSSYGYKGENIAMGYSTPEAVVEGWMNSEGHKANILNENYTDIGIGYRNGYWVQNFGG